MRRSAGSLVTLGMRVVSLWARRLAVHPRDPTDGDSYNCVFYPGVMIHVVEVSCEMGRTHGKADWVRAGVNDPAGQRSATRRSDCRRRSAR